MGTDVAESSSSQRLKTHRVVCDSNDRENAFSAGERRMRRENVTREREREKKS